MIEQNKIEVGKLTNDYPTKWQEEFPYRWDQDDQVSRREFLRLTVISSGALFAGTLLLAVLSKLKNRKPVKSYPIVQADKVKEGEAFYFNYPEPDDQAVLIRLPNERFVAYSQKCTHLSCSVFYQAEEKRLFCPCHEGVFDPGTGEPISGPPQRRLPQITLRQENKMIIAVDEVL